MAIVDTSEQTIKEPRLAVQPPPLRSAPPSGAPDVAVREAPSQPRWRRLPRSAFRPRPISIHVRVHPLQSLRYKGFLLLWFHTVATAGAFWAQQLTIGWLTYYLTRSPFLTSLALGMQMLPFALAAPLAGYVADRWDRRRVLAVVPLYQAALTSIFAVVVALGLTETWHIFVFAAATGVSMAVADITKIALVPSIVPKSSLVNAFALNILAFNATRLVVPAAAGVMIVYLGPGTTLAAGAGLAVVAALAAVGMSPDLTSGRRERSGKEPPGLVEAARYVRNQPVLLAVMLLGAAPSLLVMPFVHSLMPTYASEVFAVGPSGLGLLISVIGIGGLLGGLAVATLGDIRYKGRFMIVSLAVAALAAAMFSQTETLITATPFLMVLAGTTSSFFAVSTATIQSVIPDELRSRVSSIAAMMLGSLLLGGAASGALAGLWGAPLATLVGAGLLGVYVAIVAVRFPELRAFGERAE